MSTAYPKFAVVGHPNKGKSSIVSTLAFDESVAISPVPGTTTRQRAYPLRIDGETLYELYDTPGFQRARAVLEWLRREPVSADKKPERVRQFIHAHRRDPRFADEIELLEPVMNGAGVVYVVDGSKPYGSEYEAEMEILRWTGQPTMALINLIGDEDYVENWERALGQYFRMVRVFNPMKAGFAQMTALLESMAQLKEAWTAPVKHAIGIFERYQRRKIDDSAAQIAELMAGALGHIETMGIGTGSATKTQKERIAKRYREALRRIEKEAYARIAQTWNHRRLEPQEQSAVFEGIDLFSKQSESLFGLGKKELILTGALSGALGGSGIDLALGGSSLMLGSALGAVTGGAGAALGFGKLARLQVLGRTLGSNTLQAGPLQDRNVPHILLRRALYFTREVANRPHADRRRIRLEHELLSRRGEIDADTKKALEKLHRKFASGHPVKKEFLQQYAEHIRQILLEQIPH